MKACLYIGTDGNEWARELFPDKSPGELPIAGKSWCRHAIDLCSQLGMTDVYVAECFFHENLRDRTGSGAYWNLNLHKQACTACASPEGLFAQIPELNTPDDDLLIFWGQVLPDVDDIGTLLQELRPVTTPPERLPAGIWLMRDGKLYECTRPLHRMDSLKKYFDLNFRLLENPGIYTLPCYSAEPGVNIGQNVMIMPHCSIEPPVIIQNNCAIERSVALRNGVIIGHEVLIDRASAIEHSIIFDYTCIGKNLFIRNKIVSGSVVIDVDSGVFTEVGDSLLVTSSRQTGFNSYRAAEFLVALTIVIMLLPLFLLSRPFKRWLNGLAFFQFLFRVYPKCWLVLFGKARLVRLDSVSDNYAFRRSDQWLRYMSNHQRDMEDIYFNNHRSVQLMISTVVASLFKRLFTISGT